MSTLSKYNEKKQLMAKLADELKKLEESEELKKEMQFRSDIEKLLDKYGKAAKQAYGVLLDIDPSIAAAGINGSAKVSSSRTRAIMIYTNPHTKEVVKTKGGNNNTLKEWRAKWGPEAVDSWKKPA